MASEKISALPSAGPLDGTELVPIVQGGANVKVSVRTLLAWLLRNLSATEIPYFDGTDLQGDGGILRFSPGLLDVTSLLFNGTLQNGAASFSVGTSGDVVCNSVSPANGATAAGVLTNFTIASGIVTAAS
jgi:hypothetical protein